jgi:DNA-binding MarR family transcriptional regulator
MSRPVDDLWDRNAVLLRAALTRAEAMGEEVLRPLALTGREYGVLALLEREQSAGNQRHLGGLLGIDRTTTAKVMARLEERGLVRRTTDPVDRRSYRLRLTPAGRRLRSRAASALTACDDEFTGVRLSPEEAAVLRDLLRRLV